MKNPIWSTVDDYFNGLLITADEALDAALAASDAAGLPSINVAANQGKFLHLLARVLGAKRILEIGTLGGYSTLWLGRALPVDGRLISLEMVPKHVAVARANIAHAGLADRIEVREGDATRSLDALAAERPAPFDLVFIDADKPRNADYFSRALALTRVGGVIIVDNVVRDGVVADASTMNEAALGVRRLMDLAAAEPRVTGTAIQTVGAKGYDGLALFMVIDPT